MAERAVHWHEGMFLLPHQMQLTHRHTLQGLHVGHKWDLHYDWGLRAMELDLAALANHRFAVRSLQARLRDGTLLSVPEDGVLSALDLKPALEKSGAVTVSLGVPLLQLGKANVPGEDG